MREVDLNSAVNHFSKPVMDEEFAQNRRQYQRDMAREKKKALTMTAIALLAVGSFVGAKVKQGLDSPSCKGEQTIEAVPGDRLQTLEQENIRVSKGYLDLREVGVTIRRPTAEGIVEVEGTSIMPRDQITMPTVCKG